MPSFLTLPRLEELLARIGSLRTAVVGDFTLDGYWHADMTRSVLSRETPLFPRPIVRERYSCGGAANVAWNLAALGPASARCFTVLGSDWRGSLLRQILGEVGADPRDVVVDGSRRTPFYGKILLEADESSQEDARLDFINTDPLSLESEDELLARLEAALPELDAVAIADYQPGGVITRRVLDRLNELATANPQIVFAVDSRERIGQFTNMVRKPNRTEAARWLSPDRMAEMIELEEFAAAALHPQIDCGCPLFITLGAAGCLVITGGESHLVPAVRLNGPLDTVGAGDTFLAAMTLALAAGAAAVEAARLGNLAAGVTIQNIGITGAAVPEDVLALAAREEQ